MNAPPNEDHNWTVCSDSDDVEMDLPDVEVEEVEEREWSVCSEEAEHDRCTEAMDYVNQLIARMNEGSESGPTTPKPPTPAPVAKPKPPKQQQQKERPSLAQRTSSTSLKKKPEQPAKSEDETTETPEEKQLRIAHRPLVMAADMQRLREAVNLSMSGMLKSLDQKYLMRQAYAYLVVSGGFIATSMILLSMSPAISSASYIASGISTCIAGLAAWKYAKAARRLADVVRSDQRLA